MTRRKYLGFLLQSGLVLAWPKDGISSTQIIENQEPFFDKNQTNIIKVLCQTIIPKTNSPGAIEAGVPHFVDLYLQNVVSESNQKAFLEMFEAYIVHLNKLKINLKSTSKALTEQMTIDEKGEHRRFIKALKVMVLKGYFTNEKALKQLFQYVAVPGTYKADISKTELGKIWIN